MAKDQANEGTACPECGEPVACGMRLGQDTCWCMAHPPLAPDPTLPADACLCERCLRRRLAVRAAEEAGTRG